MLLIQTKNIFIYTGKRCTAGFVLDESSSTCVGVTNKKYPVGNQDGANSACGVFKGGAGTHVSGSTLCSKDYRKTIEVIIIHFVIFPTILYPIIFSVNLALEMDI